MVMKWINSTPKEDTECGIDYWLSKGDTKLPVLYRERYVSIHKWGDISIRYPSEYNKFIDGTIEADLYIFAFTDAVIFCLTADISSYLKSKLPYQIYPNNDGTKGCYIPITQIPHLLQTISRSCERMRW